MITLGAKLKQLRKDLHYTADYVAENIGVSRSAIYFWENNTNEPKANYLQKLAEFYQVSIDYLLYDTDEPITHTIPVVARSKGNTVPKHNITLTDEQYNALLEIIEQARKNKED